MTTYATENIRNIALVGHAGAGKTTLTEALLAKAGVIQAPGTVEKGTTVSDHEPEEKEHQHSLNTTVISFDCNQTHINLIDTPGYPDFMGKTISAIPAVDALAVVINAQTGIEPATRFLMDWATGHKFCRMIIINKIDDELKRLPKLLGQIQEQFGKECLPMNLPDKSGTGVVDCFFGDSGEAAFSSVAEVHTALVDQVVEVDEDLMALYLEQGEISPEQLHDPFEKALREGHLVPVYFMSARNDIGTGELLEVFERLMPNPLEGTAHRFLDFGESGETEFDVEPDPARHALAQVFKISHDPFVGKLGVFRIHQGKITRDTQLYVDDHTKPFKVGHLFKVGGKEHTEIEKGVPGDICAIAKVDDLRLNTILHDSNAEKSVHFRLDGLPVPMQGIAISPKSHGDEQKISDGLEKLTAEDPCLTVERNSATNETVLRGLGDLHIRIALQALKDRYHVEVETGIPSIAYRETITAPAEGHYRHKKQSGGAGQFGEVFLRVEPLERGLGLEFVDKIVGASIPGQFIPAVEKGVRQATELGTLAGYPIHDVRVTVYDGKHHPVDSNEVSFVIAAKKAFFDAYQKARPLILEPVVGITVSVPDGKIGDITGDLSSRRGHIHDTVADGNGMVRIVGQVPLAELNHYQSRLKAMTGGEGSFGIEGGEYEPTPPNVQQDLIKAFKQRQSA